MIFQAIITIAIVGVIIISTVIAIRVYQTYSELRVNADISSTLNHQAHKNIDSKVNESIQSLKMTDSHILSNVSVLEDEFNVLSLKTESNNALMNETVGSLNRKVDVLQLDILKNVTNQMDNVVQEVDEELLHSLADAKEIQKNVIQTVQAFEDEWSRKFADNKVTEETMSQQLGFMDARLAILSNQMPPMVERVVSLESSLNGLTNSVTGLSNTAKSWESSFNKIAVTEETLFERIGNIDVKLSGYDSTIPTMQGSIASLSKTTGEQGTMLSEQGANFVSFCNDINTKFKAFNNQYTTFVESVSQAFPIVGNAIDNLVTVTDKHTADVKGLTTITEEQKSLLNTNAKDLADLKTVFTSHVTNLSSSVITNNVESKSMNVTSGGKLAFASVDSPYTMNIDPTANVLKITGKTGSIGIYNDGGIKTSGSIISENGLNASKVTTAEVSALKMSSSNVTASNVVIGKFKIQANTAGNGLAIYASDTDALIKNL